VSRSEKFENHCRRWSPSEDSNIQEGPPKEGGIRRAFVDDSRLQANSALDPRNFIFETYICSKSSQSVLSTVVLKLRAVAH
jgi:hypothetical protein